MTKQLLSLRIAIYLGLFSHNYNNILIIGDIYHREYPHKIVHLAYFPETYFPLTSELYNSLILGKQSYN